MGYYTNYALELYGEDDAVKACEEDIKTSVGGDLGKELVDFGSSEERKWYEWDTDMTAIAKRHPDVLIVLSGDGEDNLDNWECRYKGEEKECHEVEMPPFTNENLFIPKNN